MKQIKKKISSGFASLIFVCMLLITGCEKELFDEQQVSVDEISNIDSTRLVESRSSGINGTWNVGLGNFRYVYQNYLPSQWKMDAKYLPNGPCNFPRYVGTNSYTTVTNSNLCGIASYMMGMQLVPHHSSLNLPSSTNDRAKRLAEYAKRYKIFDANYSFGAFSYIAKVENMADGLHLKKGDFTNWNNCTIYQNPSGAYLLATSNRTTTKNFHINYLTLNRPVMCLIGVNSSYGSADHPKYLGGSQGHFVLLVGLDYYDSENHYIARFKDPWTNNSKTYSVSYGVFLDAMKTASTYYNSLAILGNGSMNSCVRELYVSRTLPFIL